MTEIYTNLATTVTDKNGNPIEKVDINVFDDTFQATLTLWNHVTDSAASWRPSQTILLITSAAFRDGGRPGISMTSTTQVEVDPYTPDVEWLRAFAQRMTKKEHVNPPFPEDGMRAFSNILVQDTEEYSSLRCRNSHDCSEPHPIQHR